MIKKLLTLLSSLIVGLIIVELSLKFFNLKKADIYFWNKRYMLFSNNGDDVFHNKKNIFTYKPNSEISSKTYYDINGKFVKEYDYKFSTNNYGLVQLQLIKPNLSSTILLGDSFTEGKGFTPWFNLLNYNIFKDPQVINGGLLGTGFQQWKVLLDELIEDNFIINNVYVIFISSDFTRDIWNFSNESLICIKNFKLCDENNLFFGMPDDEIKTINFLNKMKIQRENKKNSSVFDYLRNFFDGIRNLSRIARYELRILRKKRNNSMIENEKTIKQLIDTYKNNVTFLHLPEKTEIYANKKNYNGIMAESFIKKNTQNYYDLNLLCNFNINDYYKIDGHFNATGYRKLVDCFQKIVSSKK